MKKSKAFTKPFDLKIKYSAMFWLFFFGSVLGFIFEGIWQIMKKGHWENHSSTILGPFCIIYGIAAMLLYIMSKQLGKEKTIVLFVIFAVLGSALEFFASLFQELVFGSISWNYKKQFLNIGGRISLKMTVIWGLLGVMFTKLFYPLFNHMFSRMQGPVWNFICILTTVFMVFNLTVTSIAVLRWGERVTQGEPPSNSIEAFFDKNYDDGTMKSIFTNMKFVAKEE